MQNNNFSIDIELAIQNKKDISNIVRILIAKSAIKLLEKYKDKDDEFFLNPMVIAYLNNEKFDNTCEILEMVIKKDYAMGVVPEHEFSQQFSL